MFHIEVAAVKRAYFGSSENRSIYLDNMQCTGDEDSITECIYSTMINCDHSEDAGVVCGGNQTNYWVLNVDGTLPAVTCIDGSVRLQIGENYETLDSSYFIKDELGIGRVEVCVNEHYGAICDDSWDHDDASVLCRQLGFSAHGRKDVCLCMLLTNNVSVITLSGAIAIGGGQFSEGTLPVVVGSMECIGSENELLECSHVSGDNEAATGCDFRGIAAAKCQGE